MMTSRPVADELAPLTLTLVPVAWLMLPTAAVSGFYFGHPDAQYFAVGKIDKDTPFILAQPARGDAH